MVDVEPTISVSLETAQDSSVADGAESIFELDVNSNYNNEKEEEPQEDTTGDEQAKDDEAHENGTEETAEVDDDHDTKALDGEEEDPSRNKTPEPPVSFDCEPSDRVPADSVTQQQIQGFDIDSETDSLAALNKPEFQLPPRKRYEKKERKSKKSEDGRNAQRRGGSMRSKQDKPKNECKCNEIRTDPKLKTKACSIL